MTRKYCRSLKEGPKHEKARRELAELERQEAIPYEALTLERKRFLIWVRRNLRDNESQRRLDEIVRKAKNASLDVKHSLEREKLKEELTRFEAQTGVSYEELMREDNLGFIQRIGMYFHRDKEVLERVKRLKREALKVSIRKIADDGVIHPREVYLNYPEIEKAVRAVYGNLNEKPALQRLAEEAGIAYVQKHKHRTLKQLIEDLTALQAGNFSQFNGREYGVKITARKRFGRFGKAIILAGFDYLHMGINGIRKEEFVFSEEDLEKIAQDNSLNEDEKARCLFNALSFQYYGFPDDCRVEITRFPVAPKPQAADYKTYLGVRLGIVIEPWQDNKSSVGVYLRKDVPNDYHANVFQFQGENAGRTGIGFYEKLEEILRVLEK